MYDDKKYINEEKKENENSNENNFDLSEFQSDASQASEILNFSEDEAKYANGFPDWDLVPPKK